MSTDSAADGYRIEIDDGDGTHILDYTMVDSVDISREHTALSDWVATTPEMQDTLEGLIFEDVHIYHDGEFLFHGVLEGVESTDSGGLTTISGRGCSKYLTEGEATLSYQNVETWRAIQEVWDEHTPFTATVHEPQVDETEAGITVMDTDGMDGFASLFDIPATTPAVVRNGQLETVPVHWFWSAEEYDRGGTTYDSAMDGSVNGTVSGLSNETFVPEYDFTTEYTIPADEWFVYLRFYFSPDYESQVGMEVQVDGEVVATFDEGWRADPSGHSWKNRTAGDFDLEPGEHTLSLHPFGDPNAHMDVVVDALTLTDARHDGPFGESTDSNDQIEAPGTYPEGMNLLTREEQAEFNILRANVQASLNSTAGSQALIASADGQQLDLGENTESHTAFFNEVSTTTVHGGLRVGNHGTSSQSPKRRANGHVVSSFSVTLDGDNLSVIESQEFSGDYMKILQEMHEFADMRFTTLHQPDGSLMAESYGSGDIVKEPAWEVFDTTRKLDVESYANEVLVKGAKKPDGSGDRYNYRAVDAEEQALMQGLVPDPDGRVVFELTDPGLDTERDCASKARTLLADLTSEREVTGSQSITPTLVDPGYSYDVPQLDGEQSLESINYQEEFQSVSCDVSFETSMNLAGEISGLKGSSSNLRDSI